jgi:hypothetical protein
MSCDAGARAAAASRHARHTGDPRAKVSAPEQAESWARVVIATQAQLLLARPLAVHHEHDPDQAKG